MGIKIKQKTVKQLVKKRKSPAMAKSDIEKLKQPRQEAKPLKKKSVTKKEEQNSKSNPKSERTVNTPTLQIEQVHKAVSVAYQAFKFSLENSKTEKLFSDDPEPVYLIIAAIKVPKLPPGPIKVFLPHPYHAKESELCLIVKDLEKGKKIDHEPTVQHFKEILQKKKITCIDEVISLRQLKVEYKPFEAKAKLSRQFGAFLVDKRIYRFVPGYLGKAFYSSGKIPIPLNMESKSLEKELLHALSCSTLSLMNNGSCSQIQIGKTNQTEEEIVDNLMNVYQVLEKKYPGSLPNIRSLTLRIGTQKWTVPLYISYASRDTVKLPERSPLPSPVVDEVTTVRPGFKVKVFPSGLVKVVRDRDYVKHPLDSDDDLLEDNSEEEVNDEDEEKDSNFDSEDDDAIQAEEDRQEELEGESDGASEKDGKTKNTVSTVKSKLNNK